MYYKLNSNCQLVKGACRGAIYDFKSGKVFSINRDALLLLEECRDKPISEVMDAGMTENRQALDFIDKLTNRGLGAIYMNKPKDTKMPVAGYPEVKLSFLWLELTSRFNNKCLHCYSSSDACRNNDRVTHERWMSLISEARREGAASIQFIGGEPLLYPKWWELVIKADEEIHDKVTSHRGSFNKTLDAVRKIVDSAIPLRVASIIMKANENEADKIMKFLAGMGVTANTPDVVRPTGRGDDRGLLPADYKRPLIEPPFYTEAETFWKAHKYHSCLSGKIAVTSAGEVIPCIFARKEACGNICTSSLREILDSPALQKYWRTTKDQVEKCMDCEYRYACCDCRPKAQGSSSDKDWFACTEDCSYNPYTGLWEDT
ncbi:MAG TPA: SPASM domain-containing protein [Ruminiclostridium sp.]|nr:SPASM domain-containing protein [Ruminiclostridium sp.]